VDIYIHSPILLDGVVQGQLYLFNVRGVKVPLGLNDQRTGVRFSARAGIVSVTTVSRPVLGSTYSPMHCVAENFRRDRAAGARSWPLTSV
jgi:hypothetical protein